MKGKTYRGWIVAGLLLAGVGFLFWGSHSTSAFAMMGSRGGMGGGGMMGPGGGGMLGPGGGSGWSTPWGSPMWQGRDRTPQYDAESAKLAAEIRTKRTELREVLTADKVDVAKARKIQKKINDLETQLARRRATRNGNQGVRRYGGQWSLPAPGIGQGY